MSCQRLMGDTDCLMVDDILISWVIPTFNRQLKGPFPLPHCHYVLDWTKASESEQAEILKIMNIPDDTDEQKSMKLGQSSETLFVGARVPDDRMLQFRKLFVEKFIEEKESQLNDSGKSYRVCQVVNLNRDYYEDETGQEISMREMVQIATGNENVILWDAENIVRLGPCAILDKEKWTVDKANVLFNFIQVVRIIWLSSWARKKPSITTYFDNKEKVKTTCDFPAVESMCAVLTLFRQLYAGDALMEKTCLTYMDHSSNEIKKQWVKYHLQNFDKTLKGYPMLFNDLKNCTVKLLFDVFLYGTGIVHSTSGANRKKLDKLSELVRQHGREKVIMAVNESFWTVLGYSVNVFHVVKQDYEHWTEQEKCAKSDMFNIYSLLLSHGSQ